MNNNFDVNAYHRLIEKIENNQMDVTKATKLGMLQR